MSKTWQFMAAIILFVLLFINAIATVIYARSAENTAKKVKQDLQTLNITAQNKCTVKVILTYPRPVDLAEFDIVLRNYDSCIAEQTRE